MEGLLSDFLSRDHARLGELLARSITASGALHADLYREFRASLLHHIAMEEKILMPAVRRQDPLAIGGIEAQIRLDHGALAALLVPPPTPGVIAALRAILLKHNEREEGHGGLYARADGVLRERVEQVLEAMRAAPPVPVAPTVDNPNVLDATRRALLRAGYRPEDYLDNPIVEGM
jgi:hypothetical protein